MNLEITLRRRSRIRQIGPNKKSLVIKEQRRLESDGKIYLNSYVENKNLKPKNSYWKIAGLKNCCKKK